MLLQGPNSTAENGIYTGDARRLGELVPDACAALVFTDPVYRDLPMYAWLGTWAMRVLQEGGNLLAWCSVPMLSAARAALETAGLTYVYTLTYTIPAKTYRMRGYHLFCWSTPCLWLGKGRGLPRRWLPDTFIDKNGRPDSAHPWNKNMAVTARWLEAFTDPGELVLDPFTGHGVIPRACHAAGRPYLAFEIDDQRAAEARRLLLEGDMQAPAKGGEVLAPAQLRMDLAGDPAPR